MGLKSMPRKKVRSSRRRRVRRWPFLLGSGLFAVALAIAIVFADLPHHPEARAEDTPDPSPDLAAAAAPERPVYPYSIVEGGVESIEELREQIARDPVVAGHYASFDLAKARIERRATSRVAHVSYRVEDTVYWTKRPVFVPAGELIITDGEHEARARGANLLAADPGATWDGEPDPFVLDAPLLPLRARSRS
jgi:hypothetical protein